MKWQDAQSCFSAGRLQPFLDLTGDENEALDLYRWHANVSAAAFGAIQHFEVLVRNAIDAILGEGQPQHPLKETWLMDFNTLQPDGVKQVIIAVERLEKEMKITRGRVVAGVSFGFWAGLFSKRYEELWRQKLRRAFPNGSVTRKDLSQRMFLLNRFRNRLAHHDSLLKQEVRRRIDDIHLIASWISPSAQEFLAVDSTVYDLLDRAPVDLSNGAQLQVRG